MIAGKCTGGCVAGWLTFRTLQFVSGAGVLTSPDLGGPYCTAWVSTGTMVFQSLAPMGAIKYFNNEFASVTILNKLHKSEIS